MFFGCTLFYQPRKKAKHKTIGGQNKFFCSPRRTGVIMLGAVTICAFQLPSGRGGGRPVPIGFSQRRDDPPPPRQKAQSVPARRIILSVMPGVWLSSATARRNGGKRLEQTKPPSAATVYPTPLLKHSQGLPDTGNTASLQTRRCRPRPAQRVGTSDATELSQRRLIVELRRLGSPQP